MRYAARHRVPVTPDEQTEDGGLSPRHVITLAAVAATFVFYVYGALQYSWGFDEMSALFLLMGAVIGLLAGLGITGTSQAFVEGFRSMTLAAMLIGVARAIFVVLDEGRVVDTIIHAMVTPLSQLPTTLFAVGMSVVQTIIAFPVPSSSGRAVLTIPILVPLSDLLGLSRQVTVLAYQYGPGIVGQLVPTDGALMAILALAGVRYEQWLRFCAPLCAILFVMSLAAVVIAASIGLK
jgi:uncharacterized ion transporter superfamily protein YfcC